MLPKTCLILNLLPWIYPHAFQVTRLENLVKNIFLEPSLETTSLVSEPFVGDSYLAVGSELNNKEYAIYSKKDVKDGVKAEGWGELSHGGCGGGGQCKYKFRTCRTSANTGEQIYVIESVKYPDKFIQATTCNFINYLVLLTEANKDSICGNDDYTDTDEYKKSFQFTLYEKPNKNDPNKRLEKVIFRNEQFDTVVSTKEKGQFEHKKCKSDRNNKLCDLEVVFYFEIDSKNDPGPRPDPDNPDNPDDPLPGDGDCPLVEATTALKLEGKYTNLYSSKSNEGLDATNIHQLNNPVRHEPCPGGGGCKWIFTKCDGQFNNTEYSYKDKNGEIQSYQMQNYYVLENFKYRSTYMYASTRNSISHFAQNRREICRQDKDLHYENFQWVVFYDYNNCHQDTLYFYNIGSGSWLNAANYNQMEHHDCLEDPYNYSDEICEGRARMFWYQDGLIVLDD